MKNSLSSQAYNEGKWTRQVTRLTGSECSKEEMCCLRLVVNLGQPHRAQIGDAFWEMSEQRTWIRVCQNYGSEKESLTSPVSHENNHNVHWCDWICFRKGLGGVFRCQNLLGCCGKAQALMVSGLQQDRSWMWVPSLDSSQSSFQINESSLESRL